MSDEYEKDFYAWTKHTAELIRQGKLSEVDLENIAEEIESLGKRERREFIKRMSVLISDLLTIPDEYADTCKYIIKLKRWQTQGLLNYSPSLAGVFDKKRDYIYKLAVIKAIKENGLAEESFPKTCPFLMTEILDINFYPEK